jgi:hypothetical protein
MEQIGGQMKSTVTIKPQPVQSLLLSSTADIAIYGGAAGG